MTANTQLTIAARIDNLSAVLSFVSLNIADTDQKIQKHIEMAVEEVFVNISSYAYHPETGPVSVKVTVENDLVHIEFSDGGIPYNPLQNEEPDISLPIEKRKAGGLGIFIVRQLMDNVTYSRRGDKNILTISKEVA
jgi:anti-sigma regulatory factor (Ser/Thr protein kinase)